MNRLIEGKWIKSSLLIYIILYLLIFYFANQTTVKLKESGIIDGYMMIRRSYSLKLYMETISSFFFVCVSIPIVHWFYKKFPFSGQFAPMTYSVIYLLSAIFIVGGIFLAWGYYVYILQYDSIKAWNSHLLAYIFYMALNIFTIIHCHYQLKVGTRKS